MSKEELLAQLNAGLQAADREPTLEAAQQLIDDGVDPVEILQVGMAAAVLELGGKWKRGDVFLPEVVASATLLKKCNATVHPALRARSASIGRETTGRLSTSCSNRRRSPRPASRVRSCGKGFFCSIDTAARTGVSGVRNSCESTARNSSFRRLAVSASCRATSSRRAASRPGWA